MREVIRKTYPRLGEITAPYVHAVKHGETLYVSGLTAFGTPAQHQGIAMQAEEIFRQIRHIARAEGTDLSALIKVTRLFAGSPLPFRQGMQSEAPARALMRAVLILNIFSHHFKGRTAHGSSEIRRRPERI
nr:RidA family protein [uncultured Pantoea sp.]